MSATPTDVKFDALPDLRRPGVGVVKSSVWRMGTPERQRAAVEAIAKAWGSRDWPDVGLLSYSVYTGTDGDALLHYSQWQSEAAYQDFFRRLRDGRNAEIDAAVPGIERAGLHSYELYRSSGPRPGDPRTPGCIVIVDVEFEGPDPDRQRAWVDGVFEALDTDPDLPPGGISAHFHASLDGTRVLNYAEWESERAHIDALAVGSNGVGSKTPQRARVQNHPGVTGGGVTRYLPALTVTPAS
ncbi:antibiotic biosynthesis monooxygenase [Streptomyces sp. BPTC-684]|uniref:antibiotic biosynthesis monooxygenase n=1 Tax=Streptomyces sp. BPTC-684 TaxID=3043734 RepID=UPI0024B17988|nr:antibiotic biosynthesis monooxygenase [Streptomyces sp. BPTC-684]WHM39309.1 antibiotic biosynthesis monooxygenase [Streptomyces sp. BPTC-684]